jgi:nucleotide-binding universal stress UspA family protein
MYEIRKILAPTDFSKHAEDALEHAVVLGEHYRAEITLLHVDEFMVSPLGAREVSDETVRKYHERKVVFFEEQFEILRRALAGRGVTVRTQVVPGRAYKSIVEESERREYDLIVIATRGLTHLSPHLIGSTAERVVRLSRQPVQSIQHVPKTEGRVASVLCPTDLSPAGNAGLSYALSIARQNNAVMYLQYISDLEKPETRDQVNQRLPDLLQHHPRAKDVRVEVVIDRDVEPSNSIIRFAEDREIGLIVMSTHGRKGLRRVFIGNTTAEVVRQSSRPVLTVTHPFHRRIFSHPLTERDRGTVPEG